MPGNGNGMCPIHGKTRRHYERASLPSPLGMAVLEINVLPHRCIKRAGG